MLIIVDLSQSIKLIVFNNNTLDADSKHAKKDKVIHKFIDIYIIKYYNKSSINYFNVK